MRNSGDQSSKFEELRRQAKELLQHRQKDTTEYPADIMVLIEELKIHQTELEIQNEELKQSQQELSELHRKYVELYEFAPCGYVTLNSKGVISEINLAGARLLGVERARLYHFRLGVLVAKEYHAAYFTALKQAGQSGEQQVLEFQLKRGRLSGLWVRADIVADLRNSGEVWQWRLTLMDITERKQLEKQLREMGFYDSLTGLYNRNFFEEEMTRLSDSRYSPLGIIVCDLDGMKFVNDTLGHQAGDRMLINAADILRRCFRSTDIIARIGGDEFAVLLPQTGQETVERMLRRLRGAVREHNSNESNQLLTLSLGHAESDATAGPQALFLEADNRMYREKIQQEGSQRNAILQALTKTMQARDFDTEGHCDRLQELAASLGRSLIHSREFINDILLLARFHDLGKVGISDSILFKQGTLTEEEWQQMRQHCEIGHRIASSISELQPIADWILKHHEHWDGGGYPLGLSGEDIPLESRILAIADSYDAMTSDRPYRKAMSREDAIAELRRCSGTQFDPDLVEKFIQVLQELDSE